MRKIFLLVMAVCSVSVCSVSVFAQSQPWANLSLESVEKAVNAKFKKYPYARLLNYDVRGWPSYPDMSRIRDSGEGFDDFHIPNIVSVEVVRHEVRYYINMEFYSKKIDADPKLKRRVQPSANFRTMIRTMFQQIHEDYIPDDIEAEPEALTRDASND